MAYGRFILVPGVELSARQSWEAGALNSFFLLTGLRESGSQDFTEHLY